VSRDPQRQIARNLQAILEATSDLCNEVAIPDTAEDLAAAPRVQQLAFCECIRRVGEAVAHIDSIDDTWLAVNLPRIPWPAVKSTRNRLTHQYWTVDWQIMYDIATDDLPEITEAVSARLGLPDPYKQ
jgi:uncharacterized protein with HEPN domain